MRLFPVLPVALLSVGLVVSAEPPPSAEARAEAASTRRAAALETLAGYTWTSRSEALKKDKVHANTVEAVTFAPTSGMARTVVSRDYPGRKKKEGASAERFAAKVAQLDAWIARLDGALTPYVLIPAATLREAVLRSGGGSEGMDGLLRVRAEDALAPDDVVTLWLDPKTSDVLRLHVYALFEGESVTLVADYERLEGGLVAPMRWKILAPDSRFELRVENSDFVTAR